MSNKFRKVAREKMPLSVVLINIVCLLFVFAVIITLVVYEKNIIYSKTFFILFAFIGLCIGFLVQIPLIKLFPAIAVYEKRKKSAVVGCLLGGFFLGTPELADYINKANLTARKTCNEYKLIRKDFIPQAKNAQYNQYYMIVNFDGSEEKVYCSQATWEQVRDSVEICVMTGRLGFRFMQTINGESQ